MTDRPKDPIVVRPARMSDLRQLRALLDPFVEQQKLLPRTRDEILELIPHGFVAVEGRRVVGFVTLEIYSKKLAEVRSLCVHEDYQRLGVGQRLVDACVEVARARKIFEVMAISSAEKFFRSCGFDFTLPGEKKAFFLQTRSEHSPHRQTE